MTTVTINDGDSVRRYDLRGAIDLGLSTSQNGYGTGVSLRGVYLMPLSKRVIVETYSVWENRQTHGHVGTQYHVADLNEISRLAERFDCEALRALVPAYEDVA